MQTGNKQFRSSDQDHILSITGLKEEFNLKILDQCLVKDQFLFPIVRDLYFYKYAKNKLLVKLKKET